METVNIRDYVPARHRNHASVVWMTFMMRFAFIPMSYQVSHDALRSYQATFGFSDGSEFMMGYFLDDDYPGTVVGKPEQIDMFFRTFVLPRFLDDQDIVMSRKSDDGEWIDMCRMLACHLLSMRGFINENGEVNI